MELSEERRLSLVLRNAWSTMRLKRIQEAVKETIVEIEKGAAQQEGRLDGASQENTEKRKASQMALQSIVQELLEEAGLVENDVHAAAEAVAPGLHWGLLYSEFLTEYRAAATTSLSLKFMD